jgi:cyanobactin maturation PatA/PatG family protease
MSEVLVASTSEVVSPAVPDVAAPSGAAPATSGQVQASACGCAGGANGPRFVYALGRIGYDFISETRLDSLVQHMAAHFRVPADRSLAFDAQKVLDYLKSNSFGATSLEWTLVIDGTPVYAIRPYGAFAGDTYQAFQEFLQEQLQNKVDRVAVAGILAGTATLLMGQTVPVIVPELRGLYSWTTGALIETVIGPPPSEEAGKEVKLAYAGKKAKVQNFLERIYHELRNLGVRPQDRAMNFAASNAFEFGGILESALQEQMELDTIKATPSPICRPGADCWDLEIYFFYPERQVQTVRKVYRYTIDVSDVVPATIGQVRSWFTR